MEEFLQRKKASNGAVQVETQAKGFTTGLPTRTQSATAPGTRHVAEHPRTPSGDHFVANRQQLVSTTTDETLNCERNSLPVAEEPQRMSTPIRDHPNSQNTCSGAGEEVGLPGLETCTSVQFESREGTPGLRYTSASGEESWTAVAGKNLCDKDFATALKDSRGVMYRQREGAPGLELRRGNTRKSVSWIPVVSSPVASRTRTKTKGNQYMLCMMFL